MAMQIKGDWMENGFIVDIAPRYALIDIDANGLFDAENGYRLSMDDDGGMVIIEGWPCHIFAPDTKEIDRINKALAR